MRFAGRVIVLLTVVLGPLATLIVVAVLFGLSDQVAQGWLLLSMIWVMCSLVLTPAILFPASGQAPGPPDGDGGGGDHPPEPPTEPRAPRGGLPLPEAEQSGERIRDHNRPGRRRLPLRRPAREPGRLPAPAPDNE